MCGGGACSYHPPAIAGYFICQRFYPYEQGTNGCGGSGPSVTETVGTGATYYSIIQPPPGPSVMVPPLPLCYSLSLSLCELFKPSMKSQPTLLLTDWRSTNSRTSVYTVLSDNPWRSPFTAGFLRFIAGLRFPVAC